MGPALAAKCVAGWVVRSFRNSGIGFLRLGGSAQFSRAARSLVSVSRHVDSQWSSPGSGRSPSNLVGGASRIRRTLRTAEQLSTARLRQTCTGDTQRDVIVSIQVYLSASSPCLKSCFRRFPGSGPQRVLRKSFGMQSAHRPMLPSLVTIADLLLSSRGDRFRCIFELGLSPVEPYPTRETELQSGRAHHSSARHLVASCT